MAARRTPLPISLGARGQSLASAELGECLPATASRPTQKKSARNARSGYLRQVQFGGGLHAFQTSTMPRTPSAAERTCLRRALRRSSTLLWMSSWSLAAPTWNPPWGRISHVLHHSGALTGVLALVRKAKAARACP